MLKEIRTAKTLIGIRGEGACGESAGGAEYLRRVARVCCCAAVGLSVSVSSGLCAADSVETAIAFAPPMDVSPWTSSAPAVDERPLLEQLREREERQDIANWPAPIAASLTITSIRGVSTATHADGDADASQATETRDSFGSFQMPFGRMSVISRDVDEYGRVSSVNFLQIDDPDSRWDMELEVDDGAMFAISRRWGASSGGRPFANKEKRNLAMPY